MKEVIQTPAGASPIAITRLDNKAALLDAMIIDFVKTQKMEPKEELTLYMLRLVQSFKMNGLTEGDLVHDIRAIWQMMRNKAIAEWM